MADASLVGLQRGKRRGSKAIAIASGQDRIAFQYGHYRRSAEASTNDLAAADAYRSLL